MYRFAVYWAPPRAGRLMQFGNAWLGRDPEANAPPSARPRVSGWSNDDLTAATAAPRRYGFHATLKPPFRPSGDADAFLSAVAKLAADIGPFDLGPLVPAVIGKFIALVPSAPPSALRSLANRLVTELDEFRAPPSAAELERRRQAGLTQRQDELLTTWGYPYVLEEFRFHLTLTGKIEDDDRRTALLDALSSHLQEMGTLTPSNPVEEIAIYAEPEPGTDFRIIRRLSLRGSDG